MPAVNSAGNTKIDQIDVHLEEAAAVLDGSKRSIDRSQYNESGEFGADHVGHADRDAFHGCKLPV